MPYVQRSHLSAPGPVEPEGPESLLAGAPAPTLRPIDNHVLDSDASGPYRLRRVRLVSTGDNGQPDGLVTFDFHETTRPGRWPAVLVLPIWGRHTYPSRAVTRAITRSSRGRVQVLNLHGEGYLHDWDALFGFASEEEFMALWEQGAERERVMLRDLRGVLDWARRQPSVDGSRLAVVGFSHGAMMAALLATVEPDLAGVVLVMGGAYPHQLLARCESWRTTPVQERAEELLGWHPDELEARLEPVFRDLDPANFPGTVDPARVLFFEAGRDRCMLASGRDALWEAMGRPERYTIHARHRRAFYSLTPLAGNWMRHRIWEFLSRAFAIDE